MPPAPRPTEGGVQHAHSKLELGFGDQRADLDLAGRDREQVDLPLGEHLEHFCRELRVGADADPDDADLGDRIIVDQPGIADLAAALLDHRHRLGEACARNGEGEVGRRRVFGVAAWTIMSTGIPASAIGLIDCGDGSRLVGNAGQRDPRFVPVGGDAGDEISFHLIS